MMEMNEKKKREVGLFSFVHICKKKIFQKNCRRPKTLNKHFPFVPQLLVLYRRKNTIKIMTFDYEWPKKKIKGYYLIISS